MRVVAMVMTTVMVMMVLDGGGDDDGDNSVVSDGESEGQGHALSSQWSWSMDGGSNVLSQYQQLLKGDLKPVLPKEIINHHYYFDYLLKMLFVDENFAAVNNKLTMSYP